MGEFINSVMSDGVAPEDTRVLQAISADGRVVGELFEFVGHPKPDTEDFKREILQYYPKAKFKKLKRSSDALGIQAWSALMDSFAPTEGKMPPELVAQVFGLVADWRHRHRGEFKWTVHGQTIDRLAHQVIAGTLTEEAALAQILRQ